jgi:hypothetical protein
VRVDIVPSRKVPHTVSIHLFDGLLQADSELSNTVSDQNLGELVHDLLTSKFAITAYSRVIREFELQWVSIHGRDHVRL